MNLRSKSTTLLVVLILLLTACSPAATTTPAVVTKIPVTAMPAPTNASIETIAPAPTTAASESIYAITDVVIVDVENGIAVPGQTVIVMGDRIDKIGAQGKIDIPEGTEIISGHGFYLMPGLVDAHVHYFDAPVFGRLMIANGVLLVRDMGMPNEYILKLRDELNRGETLGPEMIATGAILDGNPPQIPSISLGIQTPEEGRAAVRKQAAAGVDMIKVYSTLDREVFLAIVDEAQKLGLKVVGHIPDSIYIEDAAAAGLKSSEHWFGFEKVIAKLLGDPVKLTYAGMGSEAGYLQRLGEVDPQALQDFYQRLRASGLTVVPTVVVFKVFPDMNAFEARSLPRSEYISQNLLSIWKSQWSGQSAPEFIWQNWAKMVNQLNKAGVPLMVGTDLMCPGIIPGYSVHEEMAIWQEAGIPATDVLRSATWVPANFMGLGDRLGSISEGKTASMVLLGANPLEDINNAQQIEGVFLRGQYFNREALDRLLVEAKDLAQRSTP
jgi:imidazolonepropionase-like amidohydrolase